MRSYISLSILLAVWCISTPPAYSLSLPRSFSLHRPSLTQPSSLERDPVPPWFAPDTSSWWQRSLYKWQRWRHPSEPLEKVIVTPRHQDGTPASPAILWLPHSQIRREQGVHHHHALQPLLNNNSSSSSGWWPRHSPWAAFNSSEATPLVPTSLSWMTDVETMHLRAGNGGLDIDVARGLAKLVAATYCNLSNLPDWSCERCDPSFHPNRVIFDPLWDLQSFAGWSDELNAVVIAFRGTDSHSYFNWVENMRTWRTDLALSYEGIPPRALVHGGFFYSYNSSYLAGNISAAVKEIILEKTAHQSGAEGGGQGGYWATHHRHNRPFHPPDHDDDDDDSSSSDGSSTSLASAPTVFVTGHSLGGALATLCALDLKISLGLPDVRVVSFGSPRVGNYIFAKWFEQEIGPHWRFTHDRDIVPSVPPGYMGFHHVSQEVWVVDVLSGRTLVGVCDESGEDPRCHNSVCHLGLCSSVADHLLYLSEMYSPHPTGC